MKTINPTKISILGILMLVSCFALGQELETSVFVTANTGTTKANAVLTKITEEAKTLEDTKLLILGNIVSKAGYSKEAKPQISAQLAVLKSFDGKVIFTPGHQEWAVNGHRDVRAIEDYIQKNSKAKFYPDEGCPIKKTDLTDDVVLITIDSQWYLEDWNDHIYLNEDCDIKNRTEFFLEFESMLKKSQGKTIMVAMHHAIFSNTTDGLLARTGGTTLHDFQNKQNRKFRNRLITLARQTENIFFVSGHDKNLQYINNFGVPQIISGAAGKTKKAHSKNESDFSTSENGYARIDIYKGGTVSVTFQGITTTYTTEVIVPVADDIRTDFKDRASFGATYSASVYSSEETEKSKAYQGLWGKHYREFYSKAVNAPVAFIDTLKGGLTPIRRGGGHQSKSLRLEDKDGKHYVMRALRKSAIKFLQSTAFQDKYVEEDLEGSFADSFLLDFYTTAHPYTPTTIGTLADAVDIFHTNPELYYIPKHSSLGEFNDEYGDELYIIEERVESGHSDLESFGKPKTILSTSDVLQEINKSGKSIVDEPSYIRARLFDMLIGDWDRHEDQWRWALFEKEDGTEICKPIPRDRDQAFSVFDGSLLGFLRCAVPSLRMMQSFDDELPSPKWFSFEPYPLDMTFINQSNWAEWEREAQTLQTGITDEVIEKAFENVPDEVKGATIEEIKRKLKGRRGNIVAIARTYYEYVNKHEVITGTQKSDAFDITRHPDGRTTIVVQRKDHGIFERTFTKDETKEIWIYGLDGKDTFNVTGEGNDLITIKIMGGKKNDTYNFENTKKVKLYDYKGKNNTIVNKRSKKWLVDDYGINNYDYKKRKYSMNQFLPILGANPDDGLRIGFVNNFTTYGLQRNPFTTRHSLSASYYTGNSGYDVSYKGEFSNIFHNWNFAVEAKHTSPNFAQNFFGFGNETTYDKDDVDIDFNRVSIKEYSAAISLIWRGRDGGSFYFKPLIESFEVENVSDRFINNLPATASLFDRQTYAGAEVDYSFKNKDDVSYPTMGLDVGLTAGYKVNVDDSAIDNKFGYLKPHLALNHRLNKSASLVLATKLGGEAIFGDDFELYHAAQLGGGENLRGFRKERFTGKYAAYHNTDLRVLLGKFKTSVLPLKYGITGGFDYGRVWVEDDTSDKWHNSVGGSFWVSGLETFTANLGYYGSSDGGRIAFVLGFAF
ncbi:metallophosphatase [Winogradskyella sp. F6397]|uniref:Metallophosphatase n=1 Tax=Winogradskyella marina TaxID=2785530 RepID=A0ABS0EJE6_9FLAO|nr:metallophosphatase [Winogradskyella marina]MBF8150593.1 metallophosphatase [Winogradskyella marina]